MNIVSMLTLAVLTLAPAVALAADAPQPGTYQIDPSHSRVGFEVPHLVISSVEGKFEKFNGSLQLDEDFARSRVTTTVEIASLTTGVSQRDEHLKSADFFDASLFQSMRFESTKMQGSQGDFLLHGNLTIRDITRKVTFKGKILGSVIDGYGNNRVAIKAEAVISRKKFGLTWNSVVDSGPIVGDTVTIRLKVQAIKK